MDITFTPEEERFRAEARAWLAENVPQRPSGEHDLQARRDFDLAWQRRLFDAGYAGISWPKEYGGRGASLDGAADLVRGVRACRARTSRRRSFVGLNHGGPTLIACGSEEQKAFHLPHILRGEVIWCQGFSEPGAGSDLAGLQTRAVIDGDDLVVTGQKIWTSFAQHRRVPGAAGPHRSRRAQAQGHHLGDLPDERCRASRSARSRPSPASSDFCEVFYDEVRIPRANVVGQLNDGWKSPCRR